MISEGQALPASVESVVFLLRLQFAAFRPLCFRSLFRSSFFFFFYFILFPALCFVSGSLSFCKQPNQPFIPLISPSSIIYRSFVGYDCLHSFPLIKVYSALFFFFTAWFWYRTDPGLPKIASAHPNSQLITVLTLKPLSRLISGVQLPASKYRILSWKSHSIK